MRVLLLIFSIVTLSYCTTKLKHGEFVFLDEGLTYRYLNVASDKYNVRQSFEIFYAQINPQKYKLDLLLASDFEKKFLKAKDFSLLSKSLFVINGSFFDKKYRPLGLQIQKGNIIKGVRNIDGGIFYLDNGKPKIVHTKEFTHNKNITLAIQARPRLVHESKVITNLKKQIAERSFIGITKENFIVIGVTESSKAYADDLAKVLSMKVEEGGVGCEYALNLDGGSSTQLFMHHKDFQKSIPGPMAVPNAIGVFKKNYRSINISTEH